TVTSNAEAVFFYPNRSGPDKIATVERVPEDPSGDWMRTSDSAPFTILLTAFGLEIQNELLQKEIWTLSENTPKRYLYNHTIVNGVPQTLLEKRGQYLDLLSEKDIQFKTWDEVTETIVQQLRKEKSPILATAKGRYADNWTFQSTGLIVSLDDETPGFLDLQHNSDLYDRYRVDPGNFKRYTYVTTYRFGAPVPDPTKERQFLVVENEDKMSLIAEDYPTEILDTLFRGDGTRSQIDLTGNWTWDPSGRRDFQPNDSDLRTLTLVHDRKGESAGITVVMNSLADWEIDPRDERDQAGVVGTRQAQSYNTKTHFFSKVGRGDDLNFNYDSTRDAWDLTKTPRKGAFTFSRASFANRDSGEIIVNGKRTFLKKVTRATPPTHRHTAHPIDVHGTSWYAFNAQRKEFTLRFLQGGTGLVGFYPQDEKRCLTAFLKNVDGRLVYQEYAPAGEESKIRIDFLSDSVAKYWTKENGKWTERRLIKEFGKETETAYLTPDLPYEEWVTSESPGPIPNLRIQEFKSGQGFHVSPLLGQLAHCMQGYNVPFMNPLKLQTEKGGRFGTGFHIFASSSDTQNYYVPPDGSNEVPLMYHFKSDLIEGSSGKLTMYSTEDQRREGTGFGVGLSASAPPYKGIETVSASASSSRSRNSFKSLSESETSFHSFAYGTTHWLTLNKPEIELHPDFKAYILTESNFLYRDDYKEFFDRYGTHYPLSTLFGGYSTVERHVETRQVVTSLAKQRSESAGLSVAGIGANFNMSGNTAFTSTNVNSNEYTNAYSIGGSGREGFWTVSSELQRQVPIKVELRPIYDLIRPEVFGVDADDPLAVTLESRRAEMRMWYHFYMGEIEAINEQTAPEKTVASLTPRYFQIEVKKKPNANGVLVPHFGGGNSDLGTDWGDGPDLYGDIRVFVSNGDGATENAEMILLSDKPAGTTSETPPNRDNWMIIYEQELEKYEWDKKEISGFLEPIETLASFELEPRKVDRYTDLRGEERTVADYGLASTEVWIDFDLVDTDGEDILKTLFGRYVDYFNFLSPLGRKVHQLTHEAEATASYFSAGNRLKLGSLATLLPRGLKETEQEIRWFHKEAGEIYLTLKISEVTPEPLTGENPAELRKLLPSSPVYLGRN
ncbi:MAG: MAC/perforin domain-containing protein, partial [Verrucomicrobiota bacterium]